MNVCLYVPVGIFVSVLYVSAHVCVHASSPLWATSAYSVNRVKTHGERALWSVQICWIMGDPAWTRSDKLHIKGGENAAAAAGSDLWHSNCTGKRSMDME